MAIKHTPATEFSSLPSRSTGFLAWIVLGMMLMVTTLSAQSSEAQADGDQPTTAVESLESSETSGGSASGGSCCRRGQGHGWESDSSRGGCRRGRGRHGTGASVESEGKHGGRPEMQLAHFLIDHHESLERKVEMTPNGVRTLTTTNDPELIEPLRNHVRQMATLIHQGGRIRNWDPLFREIFDRRESIAIEIEEVETGVEVSETSTDENVTLLIQAHAKKVDEFVARGRAAYREETPLPAGYTDSNP